MINKDIFYCCQVFAQTGQEVRCENAFSGKQYEGHFDLGGFMIQLIVAFVEKTGAVASKSYASSVTKKMKAKYEELTAQYL